MTDREWLRNEVENGMEYMEKEGYPGTAYTLNEVMQVMTPKEMELEGGGSTWWYACPECHGAIDKADSFCRHCGQAVK